MRRLVVVVVTALVAWLLCFGPAHGASDSVAQRVHDVASSGTQWLPSHSKPSAPPQVTVPIPAPPPTVIDTTYTNWSIAAAPQSFRSHGNGNVYVRHVQTTTYYQQTLQDLSNGDINVWTNSWTKTVSTVQVIPITNFHPPVAHSIQPTLPISGQSLPPSGDDKDCGDGSQADECLPGSQASLPGTGLAPVTQTGGGGNQVPPPVTPGSSSCEGDPHNDAGNNGSGGEEIVGTGHNAVLPTQDWINPDQVDAYARTLRAGEPVDPIEIQRLPDGRECILDGHHRYAASMRTGIDVPKIFYDGPGPSGLPDWFSVHPEVP